MALKHTFGWYPVYTDLFVGGRDIKLLVLLVGLDLLDLQAWGQRLLQFLGLLLVGDDQRVQEPGATDLELGVVGVLLYLDGVGVLPPGCHQELLDFLDFTRHI